jgi:solute carrier family 35, member E1
MIPSVRFSPAPAAFAASNLRSKSASVPSVSSFKPSKYVVSSLRPLYLTPLDGPRTAELKPQRQPLEFLCAASAANDNESKAEAVPVRSEAAQRVKISIYFATWWALNVIFNIYNKKVLNAFPYPWLTSTLSLACGSAMMLFSWTTRLVESPKTDLEFWKVLFPVSSTSSFLSLIIFNCIILEKSN